MKVLKMQIIRRISQVLAFVFFAGIFSLAFSGIQAVYSSIINNSFSLSKIQMFVVPIAVVLILTVFFGRFFCGWFCAFGALNDFMFIISKKIFKNKFKINKSIDSKLKYLKYIILGFIVIFIWTLKVVSFDNLSPWDAFAQATEIFKGNFSMPIAFILLALIIIGAMFVERFFCRYLCPLGAMLGILAKLKLTKIVKPHSNCGKCKLCSVSCPMGIDLDSMDIVNNAECISCLKCVDVCPKKNAHVNFLVIAFNKVVYVISAIIVFLVINLSGSIFMKNENFSTNSTSTVASVQSSTNNTTKSSVIQTASTSKKYKDGVYQGVADGFRPGLTVSVTVKNDKITNIEIVSHNDSPGFCEQPLQVVPQEIIKQQSTNVDAVSGATFTSKGVMNAVAAALDKAKI